MGLGVPWGVGGKKFFFSEIQPDFVCELLTLNGTCTGTIFWVPPPPLGPWEGSKGQLPLDFFESVGICDGAPIECVLVYICFGYAKETVRMQETFVLSTHNMFW